MIHPTADIEAGAQIGDGTAIWRWTHVRSTARIGEGCLIGSGVYIDAHVTMGDRVKVENHAKLFQPARIGDGVFIGPGACLTNDMVPRSVNPDGTLKSGDDWTPQGVVIDEGASIGAMATLLPGVTIGRWAMIGAGAVVTRDVADHALVVGNPAKPVGWVCVCGEKLDDAGSCTCTRTYPELAEGADRHDG